MSVQKYYKMCEENELWEVIKYLMYTSILELNSP